MLIYDDNLEEIINKQYITLIHKVIVTTINNYSYDEKMNSEKFLFLNEDIMSNNSDFISSFAFKNNANDLIQLFEDNTLIEVLKSLDNEEKQLLIDFYLEDYSLKELSNKYNSNIKAISNKKNRLLNKIKELYLKKKGGN